MKLYKVINSTADAEDFQKDIDKLYKWSLTNKLLLNVKKCSVITFSKSLSPQLFNYKIGNSILNRVGEVRDLGVILQSTFDFTKHIDHVAENSLRTLGFVTRNASMFNNITAIRTLYLSLVRSPVLFASIAWRPYYDVHIDRLEKIQNRFLRFLAYKANVNHDFYSHEYGMLRSHFRIQDLSTRFLYSDLLFLYKTVNGIFICPELLELINFYIPSRNLRRVSGLFKLGYHRTEYGENSPIHRICKAANLLANNNLDFFTTPMSKFVRNLKLAIFENNNV
ncbi:uncharacterized protein LOC122510891 isoform X1 [Leptopilina heterotoma]|uniref:uncharacterized protein LOC122510891 isoform X1 n=1 Tax=Leptopilina heterotoma TaxID=63436 RepID=UPI001CA952C4|nr:uncharacterized protein LOC122510891 isoform X1 [Leptopilina heterotoma]